MGHQALLRAVAVCLFVAASQPLAAETQSRNAIALESVYGHAELWSEDIPVAVSPDAAWVAYVIRNLPADVDVKVSRWAKTGAPSNATGTQVHISDAKSGQMKKVCENGGYTWRPSWSPDSSLLAFYSDAGGQIGLWVYEVRSGQCRKVSDAIIKPKIWVGDEAQWSPDSKTVYVPLIPEGERPGFETLLEAEAKAKTKSGDLTLYVSGPEVAAKDANKPNDKALDPFLLKHFRRDNNAAVGAIDIASGKLQVLAPAAGELMPNVIRLSASGKWVSILSVMKPTSAAPNADSVMTLAVVASDGGDIRVVAEDLLLPRGDYYRQNYVWHPTEDSLIYFKDGGLYRVDLDANGPQPARRIGAELGTFASTHYLFTRDGRAVVARIAVGKTTTDAVTLALIPLNGGEAKTVSFDSKKWSFVELVKANSRTAWQPDGRSLSVRLRDVNTREVALVRADLQSGSQRELWRGRSRIDGLTAAADGKDLFGSYEDIATPGNVYRFSSNFVRGKRLSRIAPELDEVKPPRVELFTTHIPLYDHSVQAVSTAVLIPADTKPGQSVPGVVTFYPDADAATEIDTFGGGNLAGVPALALLSRGYAVIYPHVKLGPGGKAGHVIDELVDAIMPQVYGAIQRGYVDPKRLALQGNSFGGFGTVAIITQTQLFRAAVPTNGIYDLVGHTYSHPSGKNVTWSENSQPRLETHFWNAPLRYIDNSPLFFVDKIQTPLLIMQGGDDSLRPEAEKLFAALKRLGKTAELSIYERSGHWLTIWPRAQAVAATQRILDFYDQQLRAEN